MDVQLFVLNHLPDDYANAGQQALIAIWNKFGIICADNDQSMPVHIIFGSDLIASRLLSPSPDGEVGGSQPMLRLATNLSIGRTNLGHVLHGSQRVEDNAECFNFYRSTKKAFVKELAAACAWLLLDSLIIYLLIFK